MEETAQTIIPDSCPDVTEVIFPGGWVCLRSKDLTEGRLTVSAGVTLTALAIPEGREEPEPLEVYVPVTQVFENEAIESGMRCCAMVEIRRVDAHLVNPRKVMFRVTLAITASVYAPVREEHPKALVSGGVELLEQTMPLRLITGMGEKSYGVEDILPLGETAGEGIIVDRKIELRHTDTHLTGTRAIFKGEAEITLGMLSGGGEVQRTRGVLPFSQYIDLGDNEEKDEVMLHSALTGVDLERTSEGGLNVSLQILTQAKVWGNREIGYYGDGYAISGVLTPEFRDTTYESLLDRQYMTAAVSGEIPGFGGEVLLIRMLPQEYTVNRDGELAECILPVVVQVLMKEENGLSSRNIRLELSCTTRAFRACDIAVSAEQLTAQILPNGGGKEVQVTGTLCLTCLSKSKITEILGGELTEEEQTGEMPGLVIRRATPEDSLWSLAKRYKTSVGAISAANGLKEEILPGDLILIPRQSLSVLRDSSAS